MYTGDLPLAAAATAALTQQEAGRLAQGTEQNRTVPRDERWGQTTMSARLWTITRAPLQTGPADKVAVERTVVEFLR